MSDSTSYAVNNFTSSDNLKLDNSVTELPQVSDARKSALADLGIYTIRDLINYFPRDYIDLSSLSTILDSKIGFNYTIAGNVHSIEEKEPKPGIKLIEITIADKTGTMIVTAFNQKWLIESIKPQDNVAVAGKVELNYGFKRMTNPFIYVLDEETTAKDYAKVIPIYTASEKISSAWIKRIIANAFEYVGQLNSIIPDKISKKYRLMNYYLALHKCHFPGDMHELALAKRTVKYAEVLMQQINFISKNANLQNNFVSCEFSRDKISKACEAMALYKDLDKQSIIIVPSSMIMSQYNKSFSEILNKLHVTFQIINENSSKENIWKATYDFNNADCDVLLGTTALLDLEIDISRCGLFILDEKTVYSKKEIETFENFFNKQDKLYLSSKPITQTMSKLIYPECDYSKVSYTQYNKCDVKIFNKDDSAIAYDECLKKTYDNHQVLILCPLVGFDHEQRNKMAGLNNANYNIKLPGETFNYDLVSFENKSEIDSDNSEAAKNKFKFFENQIFRECSSALIYEQMPVKEKLKALDEFASGKINVLVCSCKIDFTVCSKNPLHVVVEDADRIGLSELHQIRNLVIEKFDCGSMYLLCASKSKSAVKRLNFVAEIMDGQSLVEKDLALRREGASLGLKNLGFDKLKLINIVRDKAIIETANIDAKEIVKTDPELNNSDYKLLSYEISRTFKG